MTFYVFLRAQVIPLDAVSLVGGCRIWFVLYCRGFGALWLLIIINILFENSLLRQPSLFHSIFSPIFEQS